jgi:hypothetical protein
LGEKQAFSNLFLLKKIPQNNEILLPRKITLKNHFYCSFYCSFYFITRGSSKIKELDLTL